MVKRKSHNDADTTAPLQSVAPVVKRKRRASCLGEQERKERKRAIDREAQRSLREKTKTHIAELERTIEILRDQDRNGATASLLTEIEGLRAENERLRDVIDAVRSVIGGEVFGRMAPTSSNPADPPDRRLEDSAIAMPTIESAGQSSPRLRRHSTSTSQANTDTKPSLSSSSPDNTPTDPHLTSNPFEFALSIPSASRTVDIDGMTVLPGLMPPPSTNDGALDLGLSLGHVTSTGAQMGPLVTPDSPNTAAFAPFISEIFGPNWRCPSPLVLHIDNPPLPPPSTIRKYVLCGGSPTKSSAGYLRVGPKQVCPVSLQTLMWTGG
ncbi:hypothetical protein GRF29_1g1635452 [Pseudopithomyces chartarum]|uniref:BZIP transcription factor n=1 Tax=Pseudopithomyces chartarum TaxID=1892770 RepID=A0AAN6RKW2_9PLEO|nr:hypothetical protein GRF29_1g1635452 [Pseudopithomyces chartarum]